MIIKRKQSINIINYFICFFPISLALGNLLTNANTLIIVFLGILIFKKEIFRFSKIDILVLVFFIILFFSTSVSYFFSENTNLSTFYKSIFFFRYFFLYKILNTLIQRNDFNLKFFLTSAATTLLVISIDIIIQYSLGYNLLGLKPPADSIHFSGVFGSELIAGGYIVRFYFLALAFIFLLLRKEKWKFNIYFLTAIILFLFCTILSGNKVPIVFYILGLILGFVFIKHLRYLFFSSIICCATFIFILLNFNSDFQLQTGRLLAGSQKILVKIQENFFNKLIIEKNLPKEKIDPQPTRKFNATFTGSSQHYIIFLTAIDTMKDRIIIGGGLKNFSNNCKKFYLNKDRGCSNHPHNYYLEIINDVGIIGLILFLIIIFSMVKKYFTLIASKETSSLKYLYFFILITLILELTPIKSTGSFFSTGNATFVFLILGILNNLDSVSKEKNRTL